MARKPAWLYRQSAVVPFFVDEVELRIVLITSKSRTSWILPKGVVEKHMAPEDSATKEAFEEGGILGEVIDLELLSYTYEKWGGSCTVQVYAMRVTELLDEWDEGSLLKDEGRMRQAFGLDAASRIIEPVMRPSLDAFQNWYLST